MGVEVHISLLVGLPLFALWAAQRMSVAVMASLLTHGSALAGPVTWALVMTLGLVLAVTLHQMAHLIVARWVGVAIDRMTLWAPGIVRLPRAIVPARRVVIALAGPLVSLTGAFVTHLCAYHQTQLDVRVALTALADVQLALGLIDLVPALPLDGGVLLEAALEPHWGRARSTSLVITIGRCLAIGLALSSVLLASSPSIAMTAVIWAGSEAAAEKARQPVVNLR